MNILVTGGAGYIGSHAVKALVRAGHDVVVADNLGRGWVDAIDPAARFIQTDIGHSADMVKILRLHRIEAVLHFAAYIQVGESVTDPLKYYSNNFAQGVGLVDALRQTNVRRIVFSSTAAVYGEPDVSPITEDQPPAPINAYGRSKWMMEVALADAAQAYGLGYAALRYFNVAGAAADASIGEAHEPETHLIPRVLAAAADPTQSVTVYGTDYPTPDGTCVRDYVHIEDLIDAHLLALNALAPGRGRVFNLGSQTGFSVKEVIAVCEAVTGRRLNVRHEARRPGDPPALVASSVRIRSELGWRPRYPELATMIAHAWAWHQRRPGGYQSTAAKMTVGP